ncbi:MAG: hypothetical protein ACI90V_014215, partial [Bacillariaceae sp.]
PYNQTPTETSGIPSSGNFKTKTTETNKSIHEVETKLFSLII